MANKPNHTTFLSLLTYHISLYYVMRERNPGIKVNPTKHLQQVEHLNKAFEKELTQKYPNWDTESNRKEFKKQIDALTGIYTKNNQRAQGVGILKEIMKKMNY